MAAAEGGGLLPLLSSCLDEDWYTDMRLAACYVVEKLLQVGVGEGGAWVRKAGVDTGCTDMRLAACYRYVVKMLMQVSAG